MKVTYPIPIEHAELFEKAITESGCSCICSKGLVSETFDFIIIYDDPHRLVNIGMTFQTKLAIKILTPKLYEPHTI